MLPKPGEPNPPLGVPTLLCSQSDRHFCCGKRLIQHSPRLKEAAVHPDILVIRGDLEPRTGRQRKVRQDVCTPLPQMLNVHRNKEVARVRWLSTSPDIPPGGVPDGTVSEPVDGHDGITNILCDPNLQPGGRSNRLNLIPLAHRALRSGDLVTG